MPFRTYHSKTTPLGGEEDLGHWRSSIRKHRSSGGELLTRSKNKALDSKEGRQKRALGKNTSRFVKKGTISR